MPIGVIINMTAVLSGASSVYLQEPESPGASQIPSQVSLACQPLPWGSS